MGADGTEHHLQVECVRWFRLQYPNYIIYSIPNGGYRSSTTAKEMKMEGQLPGIPDLCVPVAKKGHHSLYLEMKNGKQGRLSDHQKEIIPILEREGHKVVVCRTFDEFRKEIEEYLS